MVLTWVPLKSLLAPIYHWPNFFLLSMPFCQSSIQFSPLLSWHVGLANRNMQNTPLSLTHTPPPTHPSPSALLCWCRWAPRQPGLDAAALLPTKAALPPARLRCCSGRRTPPQPGAAPLAASSLTLAGMRDRLLLGGGCRGASHVLRISTHSCGVLFGLYVQIFWRVLQLDTWFSNKVWCRVIDGWSTSSRTS